MMVQHLQTTGCQLAASGAGDSLHARQVMLLTSHQLCVWWPSLAAWYLALVWHHVEGVCVVGYHECSPNRLDMIKDAHR